MIQEFFVYILGPQVAEGAFAVSLVLLTFSIVGRSITGKWWWK